MHPLMSDLLIEEYQTLIAELPHNPTAKQITHALIKHANWTPTSAQTLLHLAQTYGTFTLRNALALANALNLEDGTCGI